MNIAYNQNICCQLYIAIHKTACYFAKILLPILITKLITSVKSLG